MLADAAKRSGMMVQSNYDEIGRQANIENLLARGYMPEDVLNWKKTGDQAALKRSLKEKPFAESKNTLTAYYEKGEP
ncbi:hypothetical protein CGK12_24645, partial [Vibrio parahaemolyticus]